MAYCIDINADEPIMLLNKHIGFDVDEGQGVDGSAFQEELLYLDTLGKKRIQVWINSPGGVVMDGYNIYNAILKTKTKVDTYCVGIAASIAAVIFQAGRERFMADYGILMYHDPYGGNDRELEPMKESIATMISNRTGKTLDEVLTIMKKTTWLSASEAFEAGFCDTIEKSKDYNKKRLTGDVRAMWLAGNKAMNSALSEIKFPLNKQTMNKVTNKLNLVEGANEDLILSAITDIVNKKAEAEDKGAKLEEEVKKLKEKHKAELDELKEKFAKMEDKAKAEEEEKNKIKAEAEEEDCKNMLNKFVESGRIKADSVNTWVDTFKTIGKEKVKNLIEALPVNRTATKIEVSAVSNEMKLTNVAATAMADLRNKYAGK